MPEGGVSPGPEIDRRTFLKGGIVVAGVAAVLGVRKLVGRVLDRKVEGYRIESGWQGQTVEVDGAKVELSWVDELL